MISDQRATTGGYLYNTRNNPPVLMFQNETAQIIRYFLVLFLKNVGFLG